MKIPIRNLYYLFLYAWGRFPGGPMADAGVDDSPDLPNLFARLLISTTQRLLRRGLDRDYRTFTDELLSPRGRLRLDRMIKETAQLRGTAICDFDELSHDVLHNQIIKATSLGLSRCVEVDRELRHALRTIARRLGDVSDIRLSGSVFRRVVAGRNNREYVFLMRLCEFVFWSLMPDEEGASSRFQSVLQDEVRMSAVFEEFLRNFYRLQRPDFWVGAESSEWLVSDATVEDRALLPRMITDITLRRPDRTLIIDAKFYPKALEGGWGAEKVRSDNLYQLMTYLQHERARAPTVQMAGMLLYPEVGRSLRLGYRLLGVPVLVATVDLAADWMSIEGDLLDLIDGPVCAGSFGANSSAPAL